MQQILVWNEIVLSFSMTSNQCTQWTWTLANQWCANFKILASPNTEHSVLNTVTQNIYMQLMVLLARPTPPSILLVGWVEVITFISVKMRKNPNSPWEGLISAGVPSSSVTLGAEAARKIPWAWEKEPRELSARADLVQLAPVPHWSSRVQGISKPTAQPREHDQPHQSFLLDPKPMHKSFIWLSHLSLSAAFWESGVVPFKLRQTQGGFVSLCIKFSIFQWEEFWKIVVNTKQLVLVIDNSDPTLELWVNGS